MTEPLLLSDFDYDLPEALIAQAPVEPRDHARLLVVNRASNSLSDHHFYDLPMLLAPGDLLVINDTRVMPARFHARRLTGGTVELLILREIRPTRWEVLANPSRRLKSGEQLEILDRDGHPTSQFIEVFRDLNNTLAVESDQIEKLISRYGGIPLPPYINNERISFDQYQTIYAKTSGSAAAPTAGLHFTENLIQRCLGRGIQFATVTLHIGLDTFQPVRTADARCHQIHSEWYSVGEKALAQIERQRKSGGRVIGVGTTSVRVLETIARSDLSRRKVEGWSSLYITPPFEFQIASGMITNFHLPRTTLLMMVTALAGHDLLFSAYRHAVAMEYQFYSFGDAMIIV